MEAEDGVTSRKIWIVYMFLMWYKIYFVDKTVPEKPQAR